MKPFTIERPLVTEKGSRLTARQNTYVFLVAADATKPEVKKAVKARYNVDAERVRMVTTKPKPRRLGRFAGMKPGYKKAFVVVREGQKIDVLRA